MTTPYMPACLRNLPKQRKKPRNQAIRDGKVEIINEAIVMMRNELRQKKLQGLTIYYERAYLSAITKLEVLRDDIK
ncbi:hypothetical protein ACOMDP_11835 [Pantoea dispersa]|uniref:hypothetical protein n=1 Tax=Pantoea dispersa TaxID=59814 RepID=UPI003B772AD8